MSRWSALASRAAGKWQLPLVGVSVVALPISVALLRQSPGSIPLDEAAETLRVLLEAAAFDHAVQFGEAVLQREDCTGIASGLFHLQLARSKYGVAVRDVRKTANTSRTILHHFRQAAAYGQPLTADDYVRIGHALEWGGQFALALESYRQGLEHGYEHALELRKHLIALQRDELETGPADLDGQVDQLLADIPAEQPEILVWALEEKLYLLSELGRLPESDQLLARIAVRFPDPGLAPQLDYLRGWVLHHQNRHDQAEAHLRSLRNRLAADDPISAKAGWLLGRVLLSQEGPEKPQEALSFFRDVAAREPAGAYATASRLGQGEASAQLNEHEQAIEAFRHAIDDLRTLERTRLINRDSVRSALGMLAERQRQAGHLAAASKYAELAVQLVDSSKTEQAVAHLHQLALIQSQFAEESRQQSGPNVPWIGKSAPAEHPLDWRHLFVQAAATYDKLVEIDVHNERRAADWAWHSADTYAKARRRETAIDLFERFAGERPKNALVPRALLRAGQLHQAAGRFSEAVLSFQACYREFPKTLDGIRTLVPMAECYVALGPENLELAEKTLRVVLEESNVFTPEAPEFADALFLLGDVLERREQYERAIGVLQEAIERYPRDARVWRARFLLADCYRQSALALKREASAAQFEAEIEQIRANSRSRFAVARSLYRELIDEYESRGAVELSRLEEVYLRHAGLYEADCYFEAQEYREALKRYERLAGLLKDVPAGLSAHVQAIHCHVFLGQAAQARTALARAQVALDRLDSESFAAGVSPESKADWKQYFHWLEDSELF